MRKKIPERNIEPPENYIKEPKFCEDCQEEECLLDLNKNCPEWDKADQQAHTESLESKEDNSAPNLFLEEYDTFIAEQAEREEPTEEEKDFMRRNLIAFKDREE